MAYFSQNSAGNWTAAIDRQNSDGERVRLKQTFPSKTLAEGWANAQETILFAKKAGQYVPPSGTIGQMVTTYVKDYSKVNGGWSRAKQYNLDKLIDDIGHVEIAAFGKEAAIAYGMKVAETRGPVGTAERLNYLSKVFKLAFQDYDIDTPREAMAGALAVLRRRGKIGTTEPRDRVIEAHEITAIKQHLGVLAQDILDVLMIVPLRVSELCAIRWEDFNEIDRTVRLHRKDTSTNKKTFKRQTWVVLPEIETVKDGKPVVVDTFDLLFKRCRKANVGGPFPIDGHEMSRQFSLAHKLAGIDDIHLHDTRAEAISSLLAQEFPPNIVAEISGHKDIATLMKHYNRQKPRKLHALFKKRIAANRAARMAA